MRSLRYALARAICLWARGVCQCPANQRPTQRAASSSEASGLSAAGKNRGPALAGDLVVAPVGALVLGQRHREHPLRALWPGGQRRAGREGLERGVRPGPVEEPGDGEGDTGGVAPGALAGPGRGVRDDGAGGSADSAAFWRGGSAGYAPVVPAGDRAGTGAGRRRMVLVLGCRAGAAYGPWVVCSRAAPQLEKCTMARTPTVATASRAVTRPASQARRPAGEFDPRPIRRYLYSLRITGVNLLDLR
jgi:hypothetical protein